MGIQLKKEAGANAGNESNACSYIQKKGAMEDMK